MSPLEALNENPNVLHSAPAMCDRSEQLARGEAPAALRESRPSQLGNIAVLLYEGDELSWIVPHRPMVHAFRQIEENAEPHNLSSRPYGTTHEMAHVECRLRGARAWETILNIQFP
jgi:hypothetical protein